MKFQISDGSLSDFLTNGLNMRSELITVSFLTRRMITIFVSFIFATENFALTGKKKFVLQDCHWYECWCWSACPDGWQMFNSSCYRGFSSERILSFSEAEVRYLCSSRISINWVAVVVRCRLQAAFSPQSAGDQLHPPAGPRSRLVRTWEGSLPWCVRLSLLVLICPLPGGNMSAGNRIVWADGTPTDFTLWGDTKGGEKGGCLAVFADLVFQLTRPDTLNIHFWPEYFTFYSKWTFLLDFL